MTLVSAAILLFLIMDPFGNMVTFNSLLGGLEQRRRIVVILRESVIAFSILLLFLFTGRWILVFLGLREATLSISGGIILFLIALGMVFPRKSVIAPDPGNQDEGEPLVVPLAIPLIAGPSCIAALLLMASREPDKMGQWMLALTLAWLASTMILTASVPLFRFLGRRGSAAIERLMGMLLVMIAVICVFALISEIRHQHYVERFNHALQQQEWEKARQYHESYGLFAEAYGLQQSGEFNEAIKRYGMLESNENNDLRQAAQYNLANTYLHWALSVDLETDNDIALPLVELAKQTYRGLLKENPQHWDAKYNLERALQLFPDIQEAAIQEWQAPENSPRSLATFRADRDLP